MAARALLFDLDGTVWDSFPWYAAVLAEHGGVADAEARLRGGESVIPLARACGISRDRLVRACGRSGAELRLFPGVTDTLAALARRGTPLGAVTSLPGPLAEVALRRTGLEGQFGAFVHAGHGRPYKPHPRPLRMALAEMALQPGRDIFYVGDFITDGQAALAAGLSYAWAAYGYGTKHPEADATIQRFSDVLTL